MQLPNLVAEPVQSVQKVMEFKGINMTNRTQDGEMRDSANISCDNYPALSPRKGRKVLKEGLNAPTNLMSIDGRLCYVDGTGFYVDGVKKGTVTEGKKSITAITKRVIIFPDKKVFDLSTEEFKDLGAKYTSSGNVQFKKGDTTSDASITVTSSTAFADFKAGDAITISGCKVDTNNNKSVVIKSVDGNTLTFDTTTFLEDVTETAQITFERKVPDLDFVCEYNNRVWGVSNYENTIYGSKLGDPYNYYVYQGLSTDSYAVAVGSQGDFTGVMPYSSMLVFFKENYLHKLYGAKPSAFQIMTNYAQGVKKGCEDSLAIIGDTIFYYSNAGVMAFTGNLPESVSDNFGVREFSNATAAANALKYYVTFTDEQGKPLNMVYDTKHNLWLREGDLPISDYVFHDGHICYMDTKTKKIMSCDHGEVHERFKWFAEFCETNENTVALKGYNKLWIDAEGAPNTHFKISVRQDVKEPWRVIFTGSFTNRKAMQVPIIMGGANINQLRIDGEGYVKIFSITREIQMKGEPK